MAPTRVTKSGEKSHALPCDTKNTSAPRRKRLSRELAGLIPWSGWQGPRSDLSEGTSENTREQSLFSGEEKRSSTEMTEQAEWPEIELSADSNSSESLSSEDTGSEESNDLHNDGEEAEYKGLGEVLGVNLDEADNAEVSGEYLVFGQSEAMPNAVAQGRDRISNNIGRIESRESAAALAGPRCPLCVCPINGVFFPVVQCEDCGRQYHFKCIGFEGCPEDHPFNGTSIPKAELCTGCGCPDGRDLGVFCGYPGIMFHRRDQDLDFEEYFEKGRLMKAGTSDLV